MFKRLRERIAEEATKFPVGQLNNSNTGKQLSDSESKAAGATSTEDLITLSDSSAVVVPHTSSQQFSIGEDEDGSISEQSTPQRKQNESANGSTNEHSFYSPSSRDHPAGTGSDFFGQEYKPSKSNYIPQSDIESEREDPPTLNLEGISKDQLLSAIEILKARGHKYKNKYVEVVKNYKELREEKLKIETTLIEQQDKALRRMAELREQCHLEQKAKAHLEANLRLTLEEKDSRICVLETQINLLKENPKPLSDVNETHNSDACGNTLLDSSVTNTLDSSLLEEKLDKLEHQLNQANKTITAQTDQISLLRKQNESISQELEEKMSRLNEMEDEEGQLKSKHEFILQGLQNRLKELETQQEESLMAMAETKKNMHEELEFKEKQLVKAEEEAKQFQASYEAEKQNVLELQKQHEEKIKTLQHQLESTESMLEEEKQNLMQELARGKSAAITLVQQECNKKIAAVEEEWKIKLEGLQKEKNENSDTKVTVIEEKLRQQKQTVEELNSIIEQLENENATLKTSLEKVQSDLALSSTEINKLQTAYMDLKDLSDKKSLQYEEQLKKERNNRLQNEQSESELCSRYKSLKEQLDEKQSMLDDMIQSKDSLIIQIDELKKREKQLMDEIEILKKESFLKCQNLTSKLEVFSDYDDLKNQINLHEKKEKQFEEEIENIKKELNESQLKCLNLTFKLKEISDFQAQKIQELQEHIMQMESDDQDADQELFRCKAEILELKREKNTLSSEILQQKANSEEIKSKLLASEKEVYLLKGILDESSMEFSLLKNCLDEKLKIFVNLTENYNKLENCIIELEKNDCFFKAKFKEYETVCNAICKKIEQVLNAYELICLHQQSHDANVFASGKNSIKNSTSPLDENRKQSEKEKSRIEKNITEIELSKSYGKTDLSSPSSNFDLTCYDVEELERVVQELTSENRKLKELSEIQNIEFAQNITQLNESLSELQEERNNLSLVLQSIEIQAQEINPVTAEKTIVERNKVDGAYLTEQNKETECKLNIMELNYKVKTEITALSSQTEMINRELCALREQFNFAKLAYSEKVLQLNSKLMRRTEILLNVKEDLDASVQNAEDLKCLLEYVKEQLSEKEELLKISEEKGKDLENKFKAMKEKFVKKELSLKQSHNSQLSELKDQTKASIDKLNIEIQNLNDKLQKCETDHAIKFSSMEEHYNEELHNLVGDKKMLVECEAILNKIFDNSESFKAGFLNNLNQLDLYNSRICKLNSNLSHIQSKLQEKEKLIRDQQYKIDDLQNQVQFLNKENKDFNDLKNNMNEISNLYEAATSSLERETKLRETYENDLSTLKEKHELVIKDLENVYSLQVENEKLKMLLQESVDELKILNTKYTENDCTLDKTINELKDCKHQISVLEEIQTKYVSLLNDFECVNENLEQEKCAALKASNDVSKWRTSYDIMLLSFNKFFDESYQNMEKINLKLNEKDLKFKVLESQFSKISDVCKSQIPILRTEIINLREINETLLQKVENRDDLANAESKIEILEEELKVVVKEKRALKSDLEIQLAEAESKLKVALEKIELGSCELNEVRNNLSSSVVKLEDAERKVKEESEKLSVAEKIAFDWEEKYNASATKVECLEQEIKDLIIVKDALKSELETQLAKSELELKTALVKMELYNNNFNEIQNKLTDSFTKLESTENELKIKAEKLLVIERTSVEWENKYNAAMLHLKEMSTTLKDTEDKLAFSLKQMEEKNAEMAFLIPKEKFEYYEQDYIKKLETLKTEIKDLKENITTFSTKMMEKELEIKNIQTEKENLSIQYNESLKGLKDKLEDAEKNYATQMEEMKLLILQHNEENCTLKPENLELIKAQEKLKEELNAIKSESKLKEDELSKIQQKYEINNKEQIAKIHSFQETMKDKENMVLKLKASIESTKKENSDKVEELKKKIIKLEEEREHLMIQAQERVSNTEAKCREDIKALQEKNNKLLIENKEIEKLNNKISQIDKQLSESRNMADLKEAAARKEILLLQEQLAEAEERLVIAERKKQEIEFELTGKLRKLEEENSSLLGKTNHFESLKAEKEELNEKLKQAEQQVTSVKMLENERDALKTENMTILKELEELKSTQDDDLWQEKVESLEIIEKSLRSELEDLKKNKEIVEVELAGLRDSFENEKKTLKSENEKLLKQISLLEKISSDPQSTASKDYIAVIRGECESVIKAKEEEMEAKLKNLVRDFCIQMDVKDNDCDKMVSELLEKNHDLEERLVKEHRKQISELQQNLFEKECALDEMRDNYEEALQEKEKKLKELQSTIKKISESSQVGLNDIPTECSDWDDTWAVPDENMDTSSPTACNESCKEHLQQIESLQSEVTKCNSEIKELKILLRLSPPESMVNSCRKDPSQSIPEPTEFEYLKNIIYEYMMGKEPVTLAKVIAAVLRFSDLQTQQVIRREEARHSTR